MHLEDADEDIADPKNGSSHAVMHLEDADEDIEGPKNGSSHEVMHLEDADENIAGPRNGSSQCSNASRRCRWKLQILNMGVHYTVMHLKMQWEWPQGRP